MAKAHGSVDDDRDGLRPGDPCLLAMVADAELARRVVRIGREAGHRVVVALDRTAGFALAAGFRPSAILLHGPSPADSLATLTYLTRRWETRHVPVCVAVTGDAEREALRTGAALTFPPGPDDAELEALVPRVMSLGVDTTRTVLDVVERTEPTRVVFDSLSEMRLLARDSLRYRRQIIALKQFFSGKSVTVLMVDDPRAEVADLAIASVASGIITLDREATEYGAFRRRLQVLKMRAREVREGYHDFRIRRGGLEPRGELDRRPECVRGLLVRAGGDGPDGADHAGHG